jgi:hypothetical protein
MRHEEERGSERHEEEYERYHPADQGLKVENKAELSAMVDVAMWPLIKRGGSADALLKAGKSS